MKTLSIDVRPARPGDSSALSQAHREAWTYSYSGLIPHRPLTRMMERRGEQWWRKALHGPASVLVVDVGGVIAGYATVGLNRARALPYDGEIYEIYMRPAYQGVGLGHALFRECRHLIKSLGWRGMVVWCLEDCHQAAEFFRHNGGRDAVEGSESFDGAALNKIGFLWG